MNLIRTESIHYTFFNRYPAIRDVSLSIEQGEFIVLAGKNGSGKTVLAKHLNGLLIPETGRCFYRGRPYEENLTAVRRNVGFVFQNPAHQCIGQTVEEDVAFGPINLGLNGQELCQRVDESLAIVGLDGLKHRHPYSLSGGELRRLAIAGVLAMKPGIIMFDEPFSGLDFPGIRQILQHIVELHTEKRTIIVITHDVEKILAHATRLIVMDKGRIVLDDPPQLIYSQLPLYGIRCTCETAEEIGDLTWIT